MNVDRKLVLCSKAVWWEQTRTPASKTHVGEQPCFFNILNQFLVLYFPLLFCFITFLVILLFLLFLVFLCLYRCYLFKLLLI